MTPINLTGKKFGRLTVLKYSKESAGTGHAVWFCECSCGNYMYGRGSHLVDGNIRSCGCLAKEVAKKFLTKYAKSKAHRGSGNPQWKGDNTKYMAIHTWLNRHYKKIKCKKCGSKENLDWALKRGFVHGHDRKRYYVLCRSHHLKYDYTKERRSKISKFFKGRKRT